ncbi:MAG TPA: DMT family protein [Fimbriimonas sp.]|nr:DMT family protein [Fimbriimonas sp.]
MRKTAATIGLLICSNTFMNTAWYGHLKFKDRPLWVVIVTSWAIAFFEYCFQVPANRIGSDVLSLTQLKVLQEGITLLTFGIFAFAVFKERPTVNHLIAFAFLVGAAYFGTKK